MLIVALDTATAAVTAGCARITAEPPDETGGGYDDAVLASRVTHDGRKHGEVLAVHIRACLAEAGATFNDVDAIVAGLGPGPFTGLRVGLATAAVIAEATGAPAYGVTSLDAVAYSALHHTSDGLPQPFLVATDARRKEIYWAIYDEAGVRCAGPFVNRPADVAAYLAGERDLGIEVAHPNPVWAAGAGAVIYADVLGLPASPAHPSIAGLIAATAADLRGGAAPGPLIPLYLRRPDAVAATTQKSVL